MISTKTVLVLGAGASVDVGYPTGETLRSILIGTASGYSPDMDNCGFDNPRLLHHFSTEFRQSVRPSIDSFLTQRPEFSEVGRRLIAYTLMAKESMDALFPTDERQQWYKYFFNCLAAEPWEKVDFSNVTIITFNYDRSLETYLLCAAMSAYGRPQMEIAEKLSTLRIHHVYGSLGPTLPGMGGYLPYGSSITPVRLDNAAKAIRVIPEGRTDEDILKECREALMAADRIVFLGFGFDAVNLQRLDSSTTCEARVRRGGSDVARLVVGTGRGLTAAERAAACQKTAGGAGHVFTIQRGNGEGENIDSFSDMTCLELLRATNILVDS